MKRKKALVTGASEGIGRALCMMLCEQGFAICGIARNRERLESLMLELREVNSENHSFFVADLTDSIEVQKICDHIRKEEYDLLINNAGFGHYSEFCDLGGLDSYQKMIQLHCSALTSISHAFLLVSKPENALINVASVVAFLPLPLNSVYSATKAFTHNLTMSLWLEGKKRGIYVASLCPGYTDTEFSHRAGKIQANTTRRFSTSATTVARSVIFALKKRKSPIIVPDFFNRCLLLVAKLMPQSWVIRLVGRATSRALRARR